MEKESQNKQSTRQKGTGPIKNLGSIFDTFQENAHVEFVLDGINYTADFPMHRMVIYNREACGYALLHLTGETKMLKLLVYPNSFIFTVQNGSTIEKMYEKSFDKHRVRRDIGFYVKKMITTPAIAGVYFYIFKK